MRGFRKESARHSNDLENVCKLIFEKEMTL
jgi:hypothetical protein